MAGSLGLSCSISAGGVTAVGVLNGSGGGMTYAVRKIISGSTASPLQGIVNYAVSTGAKSGVSISFKLPYSAGSLAGLVTATGITVTLGFGSSGGISLSGSLLDSLQITGSEGGDIEVTASFQSTALPGGGSASAVSTDYFKFNDVLSCVGPGISSSDVNAFTFHLTRTLAAYRGNSAYGIPKYLQVADTECTLDLTYLKTGNGALSAAIAQPLVPATASVALGGTPLISGGSSATYTLSCLSAFHNSTPTENGALEAYVLEKSTLTSSNGTYVV